MEAEDISLHLVSSVERFLAGGGLGDDDEEDEDPFHTPVETPAPAPANPALERLTLLARNSQSNSASKPKAPAADSLTDSGVRSANSAVRPSGQALAFQKALSQAVGKPAGVSRVLNAASAPWQPAQPSQTVQPSVPVATDQHSLPGSLTGEKTLVAASLPSLPDPATLHILSLLMQQVEALSHLDNLSASMQQEILAMAALLQAKAVQGLLPGEDTDLAAAVHQLAKKQLQEQVSQSQQAGNVEAQFGSGLQFQLQPNLALAAWQIGRAPDVLETPKHEECLKRGAQVALALRGIPIPAQQAEDIPKVQRAMKQIIRQLYKERITPDLKNVEQLLQETGFPAELAGIALLVCAHDPASFIIWVSSVGQVCLLLATISIHVAHVETKPLGDSANPTFCKVAAEALQERCRDLESLESVMPLVPQVVSPDFLQSLALRAAVSAQDQPQDFSFESQDLGLVVQQGFSQDYNTHCFQDGQFAAPSMTSMWEQGGNNRGCWDESAVWPHNVDIGYAGYHEQ